MCVSVCVCGSPPFARLFSSTFSLDCSITSLMHWHVLLITLSEKTVGMSSSSSLLLIDHTPSRLCVHTVSRQLYINYSNLVSVNVFPRRQQAFAPPLTCHHVLKKPDANCEERRKYSYIGVIFICRDRFVGMCQLPAVQLDGNLFVMLKASIRIAFNIQFQHPTTCQVYFLKINFSPLLWPRVNFRSNMLK